MNEFILKRKSKSLDNTNEDQHKKNQTELKKKQMKLKINYYINQINASTQDKEVTKILEQINKETKDETVGVNEIVNEEIHKQENIFKSKLEQKRKKNNFIRKKTSLPNFALQEDNKYQYRYKRYLTVHNGSLLSNLSKISFQEMGEANELQTAIEEEKKSEDSVTKSSHESDSHKEEDDVYLDNSVDKYEDHKISELDELFRNVEIRENNSNVNVNISNLNENLSNRSKKLVSNNNLNGESQTSMIVKDSNEDNQMNGIYGINDYSENTYENKTENNHGDNIMYIADIGNIDNQVENKPDDSFNSKDSNSKEVNASIFKIDDSVRKFILKKNILFSYRYSNQNISDQNTVKSFSKSKTHLNNLLMSLISTFMNTYSKDLQNRFND